MTPHQMDWRLWSRGLKVANWYRSQHYTRKRPWELDFVRALHERPGLTVLSRWLGAQAGLVVKLQSIWMDKHAWAEWTCPSSGKKQRRELADLAVIVRHTDGRKWMWILQAKRTQTPFAKYTGKSSAAEIQLLQEMPDFALDGASAPFCLQSDFPVTGTQIGPWPHARSPWTFIDFHGNFANLFRFRSGGSPVSPRWTGQLPAQGTWANQRGFHSVGMTSYSGALLALLSRLTVPIWQSSGGAAFSLHPGAPVEDPRFPEWTRLYRCLLDGAHASPRTGHARSPSNRDGSVLQFAQQSSAIARGASASGDGPVQHWSFADPFSGLGGSGALSCRPTPQVQSLWAAFDERQRLEPVPDRDRDAPPPETEGHEGDGPGGPVVTLIVDVLGEMPPGGDG